MSVINSSLFGKGVGRLSDTEVVTGLQRRERRVEEWFYRRAKRYFDDHYNEVFFDQDMKQEIFQSAYIKLWTEIENGHISVIGTAVGRQQKDGRYVAMTCSLTTFLMAFAKTEYREIVRDVRNMTYTDSLFDGETQTDDMRTAFDSEEDVEQQKVRIVDECLQQLSQRCAEILTLFYYENKSLDEILDIRREKNASKNGLKTAKNKCMNTLRERVALEVSKLQGRS